MCVPRSAKRNMLVDQRRKAGERGLEDIKQKAQERRTIKMSVGKKPETCSGFNPI